MKKELLLILLILLIGIASAKEYVPGELLVKYKDGKIEKISSKQDLFIQDFKNELSLLRFEEKTDMEDVAKKYSLLDGVEYAGPNYIYHVLSTPDDSDYSNQWALGRINAENAWNITKGNSSVIIAVIDTGVQWNHLDISGNIWNNTDEGCDNATDLDGNGYYGDCRGYDFVDTLNSCYLGEDCLNYDNDPMDFYGHGTRVAGIAAAVSNNSLGVSGVCWNCRIMPLRAGYLNESGAGLLTLDGILYSIYYAVDNNASIISMSFGGDNSSFLSDAINYAYDKGVVLVAASGNSNNEDKIYPAGYSKVISVAATTSSDSKATYSNYGSWINIAAPGGDGSGVGRIYSTYPGNGYEWAIGTSMATPFVSGAIGLIKSIFPNKGQSDILNSLQVSGTNVSFNGNPISLINIYGAMINIDGDSPNVSLISPANDTHTIDINQTFSCSATDLSLKNMSFYIWNSTGAIWNYTNRNVSGGSNNYSVDLTNIPYDNYTWNCYYTDEHGNMGVMGNYSLFIEQVPPSITINKPINGSWNNGNFSVNISEQGNCSYNIGGQNVSMNTGNNFSFYATNQSLVQNSSYNLTFYCFDSAGNMNTSNTIFYFDGVSPSINLVEPYPSSETSNSASKAFYYNVSDQLNVSSCSLIINGIENATNNLAVTNETNNFTKIFSPGTYNWRINCTDDAGNVGNSSLQSFVVNTPSSEGSSGGSGGGGGGGSLIQNIKLNEQQLENGVTNSLGAGDRVSFSSNRENHTLNINKIINNSVNITIKSNPINIVLNIGESIKLNLTNSEFYDLFVKLESISGNKANITIKEINESIHPVQNPKSAVDINTSNELSVEGMQIKGIRVIFYIMAIVVIIALSVLLFNGKKTKRKTN